MKTKLSFIVLALASTTAFAAAPTAKTMNGTTGVAFCTGDAGAANISPASTPQMIQAIFLQGCSNNVYLNVAEDNMAAWGASASKKGKSYLIGNTNGGAPRAVSGATVDPATAPDPSTHMTAAQALGSS